MGLRFRRSWGLLPGVRLNLGLRSGSLSFGVRGLHYTVGTRGSRVTAGLPGTGLFWTQKINSPWPSQSAGTTNQPSMYLPLTAGGQPAQLQQPLGAAQRPAVTVQQAMPQVRAPSASGLSQMPPSKHVFIPLWTIWTALTVMVIGGLCLTAATIGRLVY